MKNYRCPELAQFAHELTLSPVRQRPRQVLGALRAAELIDPDHDYPLSFVCFQITGYRPRWAEDAVLNGRAILSDLGQLVDDLTVANPLPTSWMGPVVDADALAARFKVSGKTITRWRARGLIGCWLAGSDGREMIGFPNRFVEIFVHRNRELVRRGASFQLMSETEKKRLIARARELVAKEQLSLHGVTTRIAEEMGRAVETIRYTLRRFDRDYPEDALFDRIEQARPLDEQTVICEACVSGQSIADVAARFGRKEVEIRRIVTSARIAELKAAPIDYIHNDTFDAPGAESQILGDGDGLTLLPAAESGETGDARLSRIPSELPAYLADLYRTPLLTREQEALLFRRMNFTLFQAESARKRLESESARTAAATMADIDALLDAAGELKNRIIQANLRLVVSIAKRHVHGHRSANLFELVSDGNIALMRAVEKFDYARGFRFCTYATWAITRHYARTIPEEIQRVDRYQTGCDEVIAITGDHREQAAQPFDAARTREVLTGGLKSLESRERSIVERHFGLTGHKMMTLDQIGQELGISKERVRQLERRAFRKLREALGPGAVELLAG